MFNRLVSIEAFILPSAVRIPWASMASTVLYAQFIICLTMSGISNTTIRTPAFFPGVIQYSAENPTPNIHDHKTEPLSSEMYDLLLSTVNKFLEPSEQYLPWTFWRCFSSRLLSSRAQFVKKVTKEGVSLGTVTRTRTKSSGNSFILFRLQAGEPAAFGQIERIFLHRRGTGSLAHFSLFENTPLSAQNTQFIILIVRSRTSMLGYIITAFFLVNASFDCQT